METEVEKQERWSRYNLNIDQEVVVKATVKKIGPNCVVDISIDGREPTMITVHRNQIQDYVKYKED